MAYQLEKAVTAKQCGGKDFERTTLRTRVEGRDERHDPQRDQPEGPAQATRVAAVVVVLCSRQIEAENDQRQTGRQPQPTAEPEFAREGRHHPGGQREEKNRRERKDAMMAKRAIEQIDDRPFDVGVEAGGVHPIARHAVDHVLIFVATVVKVERLPVAGRQRTS